MSDKLETKPKPLTDKQQKFVDEIIVNCKKPVDAYLSVYPTINRKSAISAASRLLKNEGVKESLSSLSAHIKSLERVPLHHIVQKLKTLLEKCEQEKNYKYFIECADMLLKIGGHYNHSQSTPPVQINQSISFGDFNPEGTSNTISPPIQLNNPSNNKDLNDSNSLDDINDEEDLMEGEEL